MIRVMLGCALLAGCVRAERQAPLSQTSGERQAPLSQTSGCNGSELLVVAPAADAGGATASLAVRRRGEGMGTAAWTCLRVGGEERRLAPDEEATVAIRADEQRLVRLLVGSSAVLVEAPPGAALSLLDNPCFDWELDGPGMWAWGAEPPLAACAADADAACPDAFVRPAHPAPVEDDLCGDADRRCVAPGVVGLAGEPPTRPLGELDEPMPLERLRGGAYLSLRPRGCGFASVSSGADEVNLAVRLGSRWSLDVDPQGRIGGSWAAATKEHP